jgi:superfamily I DNA/RNA helicase
MAQLNPQQAAAAYAPARGNILVTAIAGSGKTTLLIERLQHLFDKEPGDEVLLAFNKSIIEELRAKVEKRLSVFAANRVTVDTSFAFARKLLKANFDKLGFKAMPEMPIAWKLNAEMVKVSKAHGLPLTEAFVKSVLAADSYRLGSGDTNAFETYMNRNRTFSKVMGLHGGPKLRALADKLAAHRRQLGWMTFTDMMSWTLELPEEVYAHLGVKHLLVDEAQDLSYHQHQLIARVAKYCTSVTFVGDRSQAIYSFAGARPDIFDRIPEMYGASVYALETNYRSKEPILDLANKVLAHPLLENTLRLKPNGEQPGLPVQVHSDDKHIIFWLHSYLDSGVDPKDIAIIFRARSHTMILEYLLAQAGIPYHCSNGSFFDHEVIQEVVAYLVLLMDSQRSSEREEAWTTVCKQVPFMSNDMIEKSWALSPQEPWTTSPPFKNDGAKRVWASLGTRIRAVQNRIKNGSANEMAHFVIQEYLKDRWETANADDPEKQREFDMMRDALLNITKNFRTCAEFYNYYLHRPSGNNEEGIRIISGHKSKGLEWPIVALWNVGEGTLPLDSEDPDELRLAYVMTTRAKEELALFLSSTKDSTGGLLAKMVPDPLAELKSIWS